MANTPRSGAGAPFPSAAPAGLPAPEPDARATQVVHLLRYPISALRFVAPLALALEGRGYASEIWVEPAPHLARFFDAIPVRRRERHFNLGPRPWLYLPAFLGLYRALRRMRPLAIEAHNTLGATLPLLAARLAGVPVRIYHNHGLPYLGYRGPLRWALQCVERCNAALATRMLTVSNAMRAALVADGLVDAEHCHVIPPGSACGIDLGEFELCTRAAQKPANKIRQGLAPDAFVALYVGRAHRRKGFHLTLETWRQHLGADPKCVLLLAGCTAADVEAALGAAPPPGIRALGYVEDLHAWYAAADAVLLPSDHEGLPYALLEGAASACALVASDLPGLEQLVQEGVSGVRIPVGDGSALARALLALRQDPHLCARLGDGARKVAQGYERGRFLQAYLEFILPLLEPYRAGQSTGAEP